MIPILCFSQDFVLPMVEFGISSECGYRNNPMGGIEYPALHKGVDLVGPKGAKIYAIASGIVREHWIPPGQLPGFNGHETYGGMIVIEHGNGLFSLYGHLSRTLNIREGKFVHKGQEIAIQGKTGQATGEHLHFEIIIDPIKLIEGDIRLVKSFELFLKEMKYGDDGTR